MERDRPQELFVGRIPQETRRNIPEAGESGARSRQRRRCVRKEVEQSSGGGILRPDARARVYGTAGGAGPLQRWESGSVGGNPKSARRARRGERRAGTEERRCDSERDTAGRRLWKKVVSGLCGGSGRSFETNRQAG